MSKSATFKKLVVSAIITGLFTVSHIAFAHTSIQVGTINEKTATYNNVVIGHGCENAATGLTTNPVIAQSVVFPDGIDSTITRSDNGTVNSLTDFVTNWVSFGAKIKSADIFEKEDVKKGLKVLPNGSPAIIGFNGTEGELPGIGYVGLVPFRTASVSINPSSCAKSVTFLVAIADICKVTKFQNMSVETVNTWMPKDTGSSFDSFALDGYGSPASLKIVRTSPLPESCGGVGFDVTVTPSAAQIDRDLPIRKKNGEQYWPKK